MGWSRNAIPARRHYLTCVTLALLALQVARADLSVPSTAPAFTAAGVVHAATQTAEALAPNTIATIYGSHLSFTTRAVAPPDLSNGELPDSLDGVSVSVLGITCRLFFVSPGQINFLIPYELTGSSAPVKVSRQGIVSAAVTIQLSATAPAFFQWNGNLALATHSNGVLVSADAPAVAGETIVLYAAGLGRTSPDSVSGRVATTATALFYAAQLQILVDGIAVPAANILYAGLAPGFAGLYQINLTLPAGLRANPEIRIAIGAQSSPASILLPAGK